MADTIVDSLHELNELVAPSQATFNVDSEFNVDQLHTVLLEVYNLHL